MKRAIEEPEVESPQKRTKGDENEDNILDQTLHIQNDTGNIEEKHIFPFLELPGELRNRIYEIAWDWTRENFPPTVIKPRPSRRKKSQESSSSIPSSPPKEFAEEVKVSPPIPFLGLSQVCSLIRMEFRPLWLNCHSFPLEVVEGYVTAFLPMYTSKTDRKRFDGYYDAAGQLRVQIDKRDSRDEGTDILKLLKCKAQRPAYNFNFVSTTWSEDYSLNLDTLSALLSNNNPKWIQWIKGRALSQVRVIRDRGSIKLVLKDRYASRWMRPMLADQGSVPDGFLKSLGLNDLPGWKISFGVDYS